MDIPVMQSIKFIWTGCLCNNNLHIFDFHCLQGQMHQVHLCTTLELLKLAE